jgi:hypothetical protein
MNADARKFLEEHDPSMTCKKCSSCGVEKKLLEFYVDATKADYRRSECKQCTNERYVDMDEDGFKRKMLWNKKSHAKKNGVRFTIVLEDVEFPEYCPILGTELYYESGNSKQGLEHVPSFDRVDSTKGYIKGNVKVISSLANSIKSNVSIQQLETLIEYMKESGGNDDETFQKRNTTPQALRGLAISVRKNGVDIKARTRR